MRILRRLQVTGTPGGFDRAHLRSDVTAGLTIGAMLVPQAMAYALLAGLPPEVGLYASTVPLLAYALLGTSRQLAVGPVAIVSLMTASALGAVATEGTASYLAAASLLAVLVGFVHLIIGWSRLGFVVNLVSHAVLVGFTAAAAIIIGASQARHVVGLQIPRHDHVHATLLDVGRRLGETNPATLAVALASFAMLICLRRWAPRVPAALIVVISSVAAVELLGLQRRGVAVVGEIPDVLPMFSVPAFDGGLVGQLAPTAVVITLVGFMESIAVAKVYARRHGYGVEPNRELVALGAANVASGLFGGYPVTGGFSRTAVNDAAGARTRMAAVVTATIVVVSIALLTPVLASLPTAALASIIIVAVAGLVDTVEIRHIASDDRAGFVSLAVAFIATLAFGIELGMLAALIVSAIIALRRRMIDGPATAADPRVAPPAQHVTVDTSINMTVHSEDRFAGTGPTA